MGRNSFGKALLCVGILFYEMLEAKLFDMNCGEKKNREKSL